MIDFDADREARFWAKVWIMPGCRRACWIWRGGVQGKWYGSFWIGDRSALAHRVAYELVVGPIPDGMQLDHLCTNHLCVNPDHLNPTTLERNRYLQHARSRAYAEALEDHLLEQHRDAQTRRPAPAPAARSSCGEDRAQRSQSPLGAEPARQPAPLFEAV